MRFRPQMILFALSGFLAAVAILLIEPTNADNPATQPATQAAVAAAPTSAPAATQISPDAQKELDQLKTAYGKLKSIQVAGSISFRSQVTGEKPADQQVDIKGAFLAPNFFRNETKDDLTVGSTGQTLYVLNTRDKYCLTDPAPALHIGLDDLDDHIGDRLKQQNISVALAICADPVQELIDGFVAVTKGAAVKIGDKTYTTLKLTMPDVVGTLVIDPDTHLIRQWSADVTQFQQTHGNPNVQTAVITYDFATTTVDAPLTAAEFAWTAPAGIPNLTSPLVGKPAPAFKLKTLDGKEVSDTDLKGSVYVLDFWATWCGPCVESLPELDRIYQAHRAAGLKVFAVNQGEDAPTIKQFLQQTKISIPVLLDADFAVGGAYTATGLPTTVVVGKDGKVLKVFIGAGNDHRIQRVVETAMKSAP